MQDNLTPTGFRDFVPEEAETIYALLDQVSAVFSQYQYKKIRTASIEFSDTLASALGPSLTAKAIRFFDDAANLLLLRPDHTAPLARLVASRMQNQPLPLRLFYANNIFRKPKANELDDIEIFQAGIELIGQKGPEADAEVIKICINTLLKLGFKEFALDIGHTDFIKGLKPKAKEALLKEDYVSFGKLPARGGQEIIKGHPYLNKLYSELAKAKLTKYLNFNHGLVKDLDYYTGLVFECYIKGFRHAVGSGGRYDNLLGKFGYQCPAVGFALNINRLKEALK